MAGKDRRGQLQNANRALRALYAKVLLVNLTEDSYSIVTMNADEQLEEKGFSKGIFKWLENFAKTGQVHEEDRAEYLEKTSREFLTAYFKQSKEPLNIAYRRKTGDAFVPVEMLIMPTEEYADDNQNLYLYVNYRG